MKVDQRLALEMLKTITDRMKSRAAGRKMIKAAEDRRRRRAGRRVIDKIYKTPRPSIGFIDDECFGSKPIQISLKYFR